MPPEQGSLGSEQVASGGAGVRATGESGVSSVDQLISIVLPCRNERRFIDKALDSIAASDYPKERLDVLIVDGMSDDGTRVILEQYVRRYSYMRVLDNPKRTTPVAFNIGVRAARGDLVMLMSAHATYEPDVVRKCATYLIRYGADNVGGRWKVHPRGDSVIDRGIARALTHPFGVGSAHYRTVADERPRWVDTAAYGCYRREIFERIGLFNEELVRGQDMEFNMRLKKANGRTLLAPDIVINYFARSDPRSFLGHSFRNGVWAVLPFAYSEGIPVAWRHLVPMGFVAVLLSAGLLGVVAREFWLLFALVLVSYVAANLAAAAHVAWRQRDIRYLAVMPLAFAGLHFAYGLGSLWGAARLVCQPRFLRRAGRELGRLLRGRASNQLRG